MNPVVGFDIVPLCRGAHAKPGWGTWSQGLDAMNVLAGVQAGDADEETVFENRTPNGAEMSGRGVWRTCVESGRVFEAQPA